MNGIRTGSKGRAEEAENQGFEVWTSPDGFHIRTDMLDQELYLYRCYKTGDRPEPIPDDAVLGIEKPWSRQ